MKNNEFDKYLTTPNFLSEWEDFQKNIKLFKNSDYLKDLREGMKLFRAMNYTKDIRDGMQAIQAASKFLREAEDFKRFRDSVDTWKTVDPMKGFHESIRALLAPGLPDATKEAWNLSGAMKDIQEEFKALQTPEATKSFQNAIDKWQLTNPSKSERTGHPQEEGSITPFSTMDVQNIVNNISERVLSQQTWNTAESVNAIISEISALKNPSLEKFMAWIFFPILVATIFSIINPISDFYIKEILGSSVNKSDERKVAREIRRQAPQVVGATAVLNSYRFVSKNTLIVHTNASAKSTTLGHLRFGQAVMLIEKRDAWSLVAWTTDDEQVVLRGWVFSRYLSKFK